MFINEKNVNRVDFEDLNWAGLGKDERAFVKVICQFDSNLIL